MDWNCAIFYRQCSKFSPRQVENISIVLKAENIKKWILLVICDYFPIFMVEQFPEAKSILNLRGMGFWKQTANDVSEGNSEGGVNYCLGKKEWYRFGWLLCRGARLMRPRISTNLDEERWLALELEWRGKMEERCFRQST